jgi:formylmethanofuran dehydrogenase subunit E
VARKARPHESIENEFVMTHLSTYLEQSAALHKHLCPRQVLGARIGMYAAELLNLELPQTNKRLIAFVETDGCFADGISVATGCWLGRRTLRLVDYGKVAATFVDTRTAQAIRIWPDPLARSRAADYASAERSRWHMYLAAYQVMPTAELLRAEAVDLRLDLAALVSRPGVRVSCSACDEEIINEREVVIEGEILCRSCAGERYYERVDERGVLLDASLSLAGPAKRARNGAVEILPLLHDPA